MFAVPGPCSPGSNQIDPTGLLMDLDQMMAYGDTQKWPDNSGLNNFGEQDTAGNRPALEPDARDFDGNDFMAEQTILKLTTQAVDFVSLAGSAAFRMTGYTASDHTGEKAVFTDSAGKKASGYVGAVCGVGGETLGGEENPNADMTVWVGDNPDDWTVGFEDANNKVTESPAGSANMVSNNTAGVNMKPTTDIATTAGKLYQSNKVIKINTLGWRWYLLDVVGGDIIFYENRTDSGTVNDYFTALGTGTRQYFYRHNGGASDVEYNHIGLKEVTNLGSTGAKLYNTAALATQNLIQAETGFDYNDSTGYTVEFFKTDLNLLTDVWNEVVFKPDDGQPAADAVILGKLDVTNTRLADGIVLKTTGKIDGIASNDGVVSDSFLTDAAVFANGAASVPKMIDQIYDASASNVDILVDGAEVASSEQNDVSTTIKDIPAVYNIGRSNDGNYYSGDIMLIRRYSRAPTLAEVQNRFNQIRSRFGI